VTKWKKKQTIHPKPQPQPNTRRRKNPQQNTRRNTIKVTKGRQVIGPNCSTIKKEN